MKHFLLALVLLSPNAYAEGTEKPIEFSVENQKRPIVITATHFRDDYFFDESNVARIEIRTSGYGQVGYTVFNSQGRPVSFVDVRDRSFDFIDQHVKEIFMLRQFSLKVSRSCPVIFEINRDTLRISKVRAKCDPVAFVRLEGDVG
ncbi:MAG: hypothetical protein IPJ84_17985 [Bdellovibrionales bacterium]|nr:hypothetical protein [Bdellovibrionales bacterium]